MSINVTLCVSHPTVPAGKIGGFNALWAFYVNGLDSATHCQACLKGARAKNFKTTTARSGVEIIFERAQDFPYVYICGVASGPASLRAERNLHLPLRYLVGAKVELTTYNGYRFELHNAEVLRIPELPSYWMGLPDHHTRCKNFRFGVACFPHDVPELRPVAVEIAHDRELWRIQELFRGLIMSRVREGSLKSPPHLPRISRNMLREKEPRWFPVPGMMGGFAYRMQERGGRLDLIAESWCRGADGSGMRHRITEEQAVIEERGFV